MLKQQFYGPDKLARDKVSIIISTHTTGVTIRKKSSGSKSVHFRNIRARNSFLDSLRLTEDQVKHSTVILKPTDLKRFKIGLWITSKGALLDKNDGDLTWRLI